MTHKKKRKRRLGVIQSEKQVRHGIAYGRKVCSASIREAREFCSMGVTALENSFDIAMSHGQGVLKSAQAAATVAANVCMQEAIKKYGVNPKSAPGFPPDMLPPSERSIKASRPCMLVILGIVNEANKSPV